MRIKNPKNIVELQVTPKGWEAKIIDNGKSEYGFIQTAYSQYCPIEKVFNDIQIFNPNHNLVLV